MLVVAGTVVACQGSPDVSPATTTSTNSALLLAGQSFEVVMSTARRSLLAGHGAAALAAFTAARAQADEAPGERSAAAMGVGDAHTLLSAWDDAQGAYADAATVDAATVDTANVDTVADMTMVDMRRHWLAVRGQPKRSARRAAQPLLHAMMARAAALDDAWLVARLAALVAENAGPPGEPDPLPAMLESALAAARVADDRLGQALVLRAAGRYRADHGQPEVGAERLQAAAALVRGMTAPGHQSRIHQDLGILASRRNDDVAALRHYQTAADYAEGVPKAYAFCLGNIGVIYAKQGNYPLARQAMEEARQVSASTGDRRGEAIAMLNLVRLHTTFGETAQAREVAVQVAPLAETVLSPAQNLDHRLTLGQLELAQGNDDQAEAAFRRALDGAEAKPTSRAEAHLGLAALALRRGHPETTLQRVAAARGTTQAELVNQGEVLAARALRALGRTDEAAHRLQTAVQAVEDRVATVAGGAVPSEQLVDTSFAVYGELVDVLVEQGDLDTALYWSEQAKARALLLSLASHGAHTAPSSSAASPEGEEQDLVSRLEALNQAWIELKSQGQDHAAAGQALQVELGRARLALGRYRADLYLNDASLARDRVAFPIWDRRSSTDDWPPTGHGIVAFVVLDDSALVFVLRRTSMATPPTLQVHRVAAGWDELTSLVAELRRRIGQRHPQYIRAADRLYELLIAPVAADLEGLDDLTIVADGPLWDLPFRLLGPTGGPVMADRWTLANAHSLSALDSLRSLQQSRHDRPERGARASLLAVGDPAFSPSAGRLISELRGFGSLGRLPDAVEEVREIAASYDETGRVLVGDEATEATVKALAGGFRTVHFATHALLDDRNPLYSTLVLAPGDDEVREDGLLEGWEITTLDLEADLVVLAGCQTLVGRLKSARGLMGLAWAFARAGVPTVVAAHWEVDSRATRHLMVRFHQLLRAGHGPADALNRAALALRDEPGFAHPFYWAGFSLVGVAEGAE